MRHVSLGAQIGVSMYRAVSESQDNSQPEPAEEASKRLAVERHGKPMDEWSRDACLDWIDNVVGLPVLAEQLADSNHVKVNGRLLRRLTHDDWRQALTVFRALERGD